MHRSSSNTRVADEYYRNSSSFFSSSPLPIDGDANGNTNANLPVYNPGSHPAKKEKSRLRSAENAIHLIPLVLLLCAVILWFFSNPVDVISNKPGSIAARIEGLQAAGAVGIDGTQNTVHLELEEHDLLHQHRTIDKNHSI
ncbi:uncharacterized protein LOC110732396 [Chenopodium quinoa]|uniref:uncharacterized protein LOC110732396 n=1 Tax=Chenopodium quinoa TaxID=63459 RepID=UPI000B7819A7|nr:uncharacterized protein LOC110732396 [Chenopodium quinoa]